MPRPQFGNRRKTCIPPQVAQISIGDLAIIEALGGRVHTYRTPTKLTVRMYISNIRDIAIEDESFTQLAKNTREVLLFHIAREDDTIHLL